MCIRDRRSGHIISQAVHHIIDFGTHAFSGSNAKLANILEYGKHGQPAKPFLKPAKSASKAECIRVMEQTLKEEVEKL